MADYVRNTYKILSLLIASVILAGCSSLRTPLTERLPAEHPPDFFDPQSQKDFSTLIMNFHKLTVGMTKDEVATTLGIKSMRSDKWEWKFMNTPMADMQNYYIQFENDKVTKKGGASYHFAPPD